MEIEIKIPLDKKKYEEILNQVMGTVRVQHLEKEDSYYSQYQTKNERMENGEPLIRIRTENEKYLLENDSYLAYKLKKTIDGVETNVEKETRIDDVSVVTELFKKTGFHRWFRKHKSSSYFETKVNGITFNVDLELVNEKFYYIEVENTDNPDNCQVEDIINSMKALVSQYGLDFENRDGRNWVEILE